MLSKSDLKVGQKVYHRNLKLNGVITFLETGDITSVYVMFSEEDFSEEDEREDEVSIHLLDIFEE